MPPTDTAELRRLHEAAMQEASTPQDLRKSMNAAYLALPALLDELEAAREAVSEESNRWVSVIRGIDPEALCDFHDEHGSQEYLKAWLDARDRRMKAIGAAEKLEQLGCDLNYMTSADMKATAAQLRREAGE